MKINLIIAFAALSLAAPVTAQITIYDANPNSNLAFTYGTGNGYTPANAVVGLTLSAAGELALRAHVPGIAANPTGGTGIYTFALGSDVSFDFSLFGSSLINSNILLTNILTGDTASFNPTAYVCTISSLEPSSAVQGSQQLGFGFLNGSTPFFTTLFGDLNFDNTINSTYRIDLSGGGETITAFAQLGTGAAVAAVPEPATWAMMLAGFGAMGISLRRRRKLTNSAQLA